MSKKKILVIEPVVDFRHCYVNFLKFEKVYAVFEAENGEKGLEIALKQRPDFILLDIALPDVHYIDVIDKIAKHYESAGSEAKILIISALKEGQKLIKLPGVIGFYEKPASFEHLIELIRVKIREGDREVRGGGGRIKFVNACHTFGLWQNRLHDTLRILEKSPRFFPTSRIEPFTPKKTENVP